VLVDRSYLEATMLRHGRSVVGGCCFCLRLSHKSGVVRAV